MSYLVLPTLLGTIYMHCKLRERCLFCYRLLVMLLFIFERVCTSSGCLGKTALFYL